MKALLNGSFDVWNDGTTFVSPPGTLATAEMWYSGRWGSGFDVTVSRDADVPTVAQAGVALPCSYKVACTQAKSPAHDDVYETQYRLEGSRFARTIAQVNCKLRGFVKASKAGKWGIELSNSGLDRCYIHEVNIAAADTWQEVVAPIPATPAAGAWSYGDFQIGLFIFFSFMMGSDYRGAAGSWITGNLGGTTNQMNLMDTVGGYLKLAGWSMIPERSSPVFEKIETDRYYPSHRL